MQVELIEQALRKLMADPSTAVRTAASEAYDTLQARRSADSFMAELRTGGIEARIRVVYTAARMGGHEGISIMLGALDDAEAEVRAVAARELAAFPAVPVLKAMVDRLPKEKGVVLGNLIETLGGTRRKELAPVVERYLSDPDPEVRAKAVIAYARTAEMPWPLLMQNAASPNETVRAAAARALGEWTAPAPPR